MWNQDHRNDATTQRRNERQEAKAEPSFEEERIGAAVIDAAFNVHRALGPGLLESVYEVCFCHELKKAGFRCERQLPVRIVHDGLVFEEASRMDVLVEDRVICELKAVEQVHPVSFAQLLSHLRLTHRTLGYLINFNLPLLKEGISRMISSP